MSDSESIRLKVDEIRAALEGYSREQLVEVLTYVFKTYVVEGGVPLGSGAGAVLDARSELDGLGFAQLVTWLQQHLDVPELALLEVEGGRVAVRAGGRAVPLEPPRPSPPPDGARQGEVRAQPEPPPAPAVVAPPAPVAAPAPATAAPAPVASRGAQVTGAPTLAPTSPPPAPTPAPGSPTQPAKADEPSGEESRFSRLELDD